MYHHSPPSNQALKTLRKIEHRPAYNIPNASKRYDVRPQLRKGSVASRAVSKWSWGGMCWWACLGSHCLHNPALFNLCAIFRSTRSLSPALALPFACLSDVMGFCVRASLQRRFSVALSPLRTRSSFFIGRRTFTLPCTMAPWYGVCVCVVANLPKIKPKPVSNWIENRSGLDGRMYSSTITCCCCCC